MIEIDARDISNAGDAESSTRPPPPGMFEGTAQNATC
jgi:hypothetical protein